MTREEIIQGLQFTIDMFLLDPNTGETFTEPRNDMDKTTIDACRGAIKALKDNSYKLWKESYEVEHSRNIRLKEQIQSLEQELKTGRCKDCKWWKDSDGIYRRGVDAESQCPINRREVCEGTGYCYMFEPQESEDDEE